MAKAITTIKCQKRSINALKPRASVYRAWCEDQKGLGVKVQPTGTKTYILKYRTKYSHISREMTLGDTETVTPALAKEDAQKFLARVAAGGDPLQEKRDEGKAEIAKNLADANEQRTLGEFMEYYMTNWVAVEDKESTADNIEASIQLQIYPNIPEDTPVKSIKKSQIQGLKAKLKDKPGAFNRALASLSKAFNFAIDTDFFDGTNPCSGVKKYEIKQRRRYLSKQEFAEFGRILTELRETGEENIYSIGAMFLYLFTGCRRGEILSLKWEYVDFEMRRLHLPDSKTGQKDVMLNDNAIAILKAIPRVPGNPYVMVGRKPGKHIYDLKGPWQRTRDRMGLEDFRLHDLRHSFGATAIRKGIDVKVLQELMGHKDYRTTLRYAHAAEDVIEEASQQVGGIVDDLLNPIVETDNVTKLRRKA